jgi:hypothetical protein
MSYRPLAPSARALRVELGINTGIVRRCRLNHFFMRWSILEKGLIELRIGSRIDINDDGADSFHEESIIPICFHLMVDSQE